jgi:hypothetical protein
MRRSPILARNNPRRQPGANQESGPQREVAVHEGDGVAAAVPSGAPTLVLAWAGWW